MDTPFASLLETHGWTNHDVVEAAEGQLSHKNVQKARTGSRPVTDAVARSLARAAQNLLAASEERDEEGKPRTVTVRELFPGYPRGKGAAPAGSAAQD